MAAPPAPPAPTVTKTEAGSSEALTTPCVYPPCAPAPPPCPARPVKSLAPDPPPPPPPKIWDSTATAVEGLGQNPETVNTWTGDPPESAAYAAPRVSPRETRRLTRLSHTSAVGPI